VSVWSHSEVHAACQTNCAHFTREDDGQNLHNVQPVLHGELPSAIIGARGESLARRASTQEDR
jgi:hypothetical protein